jgi:hypothetical protein
VIDIDIVLLVLKIGILVLLYVFIWRVVRTAVRDVRRGAAVVVTAPEAVAAGRSPAAASARPAAAREAGWAPAPGEVSVAAPGASRLVVEEGPGLPAGGEIVLEGPVTVGRDPGCDVVLAETVVSGRHARLVPRGRGYAVEDLGSTNGTFVDDQPVTAAPLRRGSRLRIGDTVFRYEE